ncbi:hypothetical protein OG21DRAFT_582450 [Imleria badia]|nr:hypothetical protein OG21DRAFT_582450 [Imleria badia]
MDMELYKSNVYGKGAFFEAHKDTSRSQDMFGSLVVVLPTVHEGGQLVLRLGQKEWTIDFTETFATATEPSVRFVALFSDLENEVLPVTSGYRVTFTYKFYRKLMHPPTTITPFHLKLKQALVDLRRYSPMAAIWDSASSTSASTQAAMCSTRCWPS